MMKWLTRFFITLFIFLLSGYGKLHAATAYRDCLCDITINPDKPVHSIFNTAKKCDQSVVLTSLSRAEKVNDKIDPSDNEDEDDKQISLKKQVEVNKYFTTVFNIQTPAYFNHTIKERLILSKHSFYFISYRWYILFRVIRI